MATRCCIQFTNAKKINDLFIDFKRRNIDEIKKRLAMTQFNCDTYSTTVRQMGHSGESSFWLIEPKEGPLARSSTKKLIKNC